MKILSYLFIAAFAGAAAHAATESAAPNTVPSAEQVEAMAAVLTAQKIGKLPSGRQALIINSLSEFNIAFAERDGTPLGSGEARTHLMNLADARCMYRAIELVQSGGITTTHDFAIARLDCLVAKVIAANEPVLVILLPKQQR